MLFRSLLIGSGDTTGSLARNWRVMAEHVTGAKTAIIPNAKHWMFEQDPEEFSRVVRDFLAG